DWVLQRKTAALQAIARTRELIRLEGGDPAVAAALARLRGLRRELAQLAAVPPPEASVGAVRQMTNRLESGIRAAEAELTTAVRARHPAPPADVTTAMVRSRLADGAA